MKRIHTIIRTLGLAALLSLPALPASAQGIFPEGASPVIVAPTRQTVGYRERTLCFDIKSNVPFEVSSDASWLAVRRGADGSVYIHLPQNLGSEPRVANVTFSNAENGLSEVFSITQKQDESVETLPEDIQVKPSSAQANNAHQGLGIERTYDGDLNTCWHTSYGAVGALKVSAETPAILTYNFSGVERIDYVKYIPRQDGNPNGNFKEVEVWVKCEGEASYTLYDSYNWGGTSTSKNVRFENGLLNPVSIQFKVLSGANDNASCAEMQFLRDNPVAAEAFDVFADDLYTTLKPGVTLEQIENIDNAFAKSLALRLYEGGYDMNYRVAEFPCRLSYMTLSEMWNAPGKYYDQLDGVTGINFTKGKYAVVVRGIPNGVGASLRIVAWYIGKDGDNFDGGDPKIFDYPLSNGVNVINYNFDYDGLGYIAYYAAEDAETYPALRVHFVNGQVNGYLSPEKTNEEMYELCANAKNTCIDAVGSKVHSVWTSEGFYKYCKASDGTSLGYRQFMNLLDTLVDWEHYLLGFKKYDRVPDNHTFAYTNYTYYMFQGGLGVSFHHNQESRVLNCKTLIYDNYDLIWGLSHEWGHQHQMHPYFCWAGLTEVTNNMNSYYNTIHMGYSSYGHTAEPNDGLGIYNESPAYVTQADHTTYTTVTNNRSEAYKRRGNYSWNSNLYALCEEMEDSLYTSVQEDKLHAFSYNNYYNLRPFTALYQYAVSTLGLQDFAQDLYESLRQTDYADGSSIEKTTGLDKYEVIAAAQNGNKNGHYANLISKYPNSVWVKNKYIPQSTNRNVNSVPFIMNFVRKTSRLTGYNLFPYFEKFGFLRTVALYFYDGTWYLMTKDMYDEFKEDMDALGLKECDEQMIKDIITVPTPKTTRPTIPN